MFPPADVVMSSVAVHAGEFLFYVGTIHLTLLLADQRRWTGALVTLLVAGTWLACNQSLSEYLDQLGDDSFAETASVSAEEARFWFSTLGDAIEARPNPAKFAVFTAAAAASFIVLRWLARRLGLPGRSFVLSDLVLATTFIGVAIQHQASSAVASFLDNTRRAVAIQRNFDQPTPAMTPARNGLDLVVYIGESTTVMNMGLYGYPRNTTPRLGALAHADPGLLVFRNVLSTHTHTSPSLLEALSLGLDRAEDGRPIGERRRVSVVDVLARAGVPSTLLSAQNRGGAWNQGSRVIFRKSASTFRNVATHAAQLRGEPPPPAWDDEFFEQQLERQPPAAGPAVVFLHSYAGHGVYVEHTPPAFRARVDDALARLQPAQVAAGAGAKAVEDIEAYDAAIRYVDHSVARTIARVARSARPTVLVYFADHGESVFTQRGHDSARFRHEMVRIPFLLYFNEPARTHVPALHAKYKALAARAAVATLAQLPATLLDLAGTEPAAAGTPVVLPVIGEMVVPGPIVVRETARGISAVSLVPDAPTPATDPQTQAFLAIRAGKVAPACGRKPATFEELARGVAVSGCNPGPWLPPDASVD